MDINPRVLNIVNQTLPKANIKFLVQNIVEAPLEGSYDGILCHNVICRISEEQQNIARENVVATLKDDQSIFQEI